VNRGVTLVELLVALAIASIVAAVVLTGCVAASVHVRRAVAMQAGVATDDALVAMLSAVRHDPSWAACRAGRCGAHTGEGHGVALVAGGHAWVVGDGLLFCTARRCEVVAAEAVALQVLVEHVANDAGPAGRGEHRGRAPPRPALVEVVLWLRDGSQRSRLAWLPP
jgi:prepilin-type N-terminal cleavage/methylation domain-containing protein